MKLTAKRVRQLLSYDVETGEFRWRESRGRVMAGDIAGSGNNGYRRIAIDGEDYMAHRLAWLHVTGSFPEVEIDHRDGDRGNNCFRNLRDVTQTLNQQNVNAAKRNSSTGLLGVIPRNGRYLARIRVNGAKRHLGTYSTSEDAHAAYIAAKRDFHPGWNARNSMD